MSKNAPNIKSNIFESTVCINSEQLFAYVENTLSSAERHKVERHLIDCPLCSEAVDGLLTRKNISKSRRITKEVKKDVNKKIFYDNYSYSWKKYLYSIAAALLIFMGYISFNYIYPPESNDLFTTYFEAYPNTVPILRGESELNDLQKAMVEYESKNYKAAILDFEKILATNKDHPEANFYSSISYLSLKNPEKAIEFLKHTQKIVNGTFDNAIHWYLGLAYTMNKKIDLAKIQFKQLLQSENKYTILSKEILTKLEQEK